MDGERGSSVVDLVHGRRVCIAEREAAICGVGDLYLSHATPTADEDGRVGGCGELFGDVCLVK
jgi:hypothetical protein